MNEISEDIGTNHPPDGPQIRFLTVPSTLLKVSRARSGWHGGITTARLSSRQFSSFIFTSAFSVPPLQKPSASEQSVLDRVCLVLVLCRALSFFVVPSTTSEGRHVGQSESDTRGRHAIGQLPASGHETCRTSSQKNTLVTKAACACLLSFLAAL